MVGKLRFAIAVGRVRLALREEKSGALPPSHKRQYERWPAVAATTRADRKSLRICGVPYCVDVRKCAPKCCSASAGVQCGENYGQRSRDRCVGMMRGGEATGAETAVVGACSFVESLCFSSCR